MKKCPNCNKIYRDFDQYCLICRYKLKYIDGSEKVEYAPSQHTTTHTSSKPTVECPYCHSTDTRKISGTTRWLSAGIFGLSSNKIGKNFHCKNCGADF